ncbi:MAG: IS1595 family transposase [Proteobacteria bacterium]|nr:IS1595 family transposase [Pseudomonadota bacterium]
MTTPLDLTNPIYQHEDAARAHLEEIRWPNGVVCPHCGETENSRPLRGKSMGPGWYYCPDCRGKFTIRVGTVYERSHIPLHKWLLGFRLMASSKKGMSAHQLHRTLGITYKSAWFMCHRIREAMKEDSPEPLGSGGGAVEVDETFIGYDETKKPRGQKKGRGYHHKHKVLSLVDRDSGQARSMVINDLKANTLAPLVRENLVREARLMTDEAAYYTKVGREFAEHGIVHHGRGEYVRGDIHTNTIEGYFSIFKRGMKGVYQHCGEQHLQRYLNEFDFRYSNRSALGIEDAERTTLALKGAEGKRLTYRRPNERRATA